MRHWLQDVGVVHRFDERIGLIRGQVQEIGITDQFNTRIDVVRGFVQDIRFINRIFEIFRPREVHRQLIMIAETTEAIFSRFQFQQDMTIGESIEIDIGFANLGESLMEGEYTVGIYDTRNNLLQDYPTPPVSLEPGDTKERSVKHTPDEVGTYIVGLDGKIGGRELQTHRFLYVREETEPPETITRTVTRREYVHPPEPEPPEESWDVTVPESFTISEEDGGMIPVEVENTGEAIIERVSIEIDSSENVSVEPTPKVMFGIEPESSKKFLLNVEARERELGEELIRLRLRSESLSTRWKEIDLEVYPDLTIDQLRSRVDSLHSLATSAKSEIRVSERLGLNVTGPLSKIDRSMDKIEQARRYLDGEEIEQARGEIKDAEELIDEAYRELFVIRSEVFDMEVPIVRLVYIFFIVFVGIAASMVIFYYYLKKKKNKRPKLLREMDR